MNRKDFFKVACFQGACACLAASVPSNQPTEPDWRVAFMQKRMARLVTAMEEKVDAGARSEILEQMGRECARGFADLALKHKGDVPGYLAEIKSQWAEKTEYDETTGTIRITDKPVHTCSCPFVDTALMPATFCSCTLGWQKQTYETVTGKPVDVVLESSVLRGDPQCVFRIHVHP